MKLFVNCVLSQFIKQQDNFTLRMRGTVSSDNWFVGLAEQLGRWVNSLAGFVSSLADFYVIFQVSVMANSDKFLAEIAPNPRFVDFEHIPNHTKHFK